MNLSKENIVVAGVCTGAFVAGVVATKTIGFVKNKIKHHRAVKAANKAEAERVKEMANEPLRGEATASAA